jgi:hypothetical protein
MLVTIRHTAHPDGLTMEAVVNSNGPAVTPQLNTIGLFTVTHLPTLTTGGVG